MHTTGDINTAGAMHTASIEAPLVLNNQILWLNSDSVTNATSAQWF